MRRKDRGKVRIGVIGTGAICQLMHLPILSERRDVEVAAVADLDDLKAQSVARRFGVGRVLDDDALVADDEIEGSSDQRPQLRAREPGHGLSGGGQARPGGAATGAVGGRGAVDHEGGPGGGPGGDPGDGAPVSTECARVPFRDRGRGAGGPQLGSGHLAQPCRAPSPRRMAPARAGIGGRCAHGPGSAGPRPGALDHGVPGGGAGLGGDPRRRLRRRGGGARVCGHRDGVALSLAASWRLHARDDRHQLEALGSKGSAMLLPLSIHREEAGRTIDATPRHPAPRGGETLFTNGFRRLLDHFVAVVAGRAEARPPAEQTALMDLVEAAYESARKGREVELSS